jgi:predicted PurR-regulated permease PerM
LIIQQFDGLILGPRLLGQSTGLSPIWVIFAITFGGAYFGVLGMFIGVPVVAVIAFLADKFLKDRLAGKKIKALDNMS